MYEIKDYDVQHLSNVVADPEFWDRHGFVHHRNRHPPDCIVQLQLIHVVNRSFEYIDARKYEKFQQILVGLKKRT